MPFFIVLQSPNPRLVLILYFAWQEKNIPIEFFLLHLLMIYSIFKTFSCRFLFRICIFFSVYDALTGEIVKTLEGHNGCVRDVSWHPYLNEIVSSSWDQSVIRWKYVDEAIEDEIEENNVKEDRNDDEDKYLLKIRRSLRNRLS